MNSTPKSPVCEIPSSTHRENIKVLSGGYGGSSSHTHGAHVKLAQDVSHQEVNATFNAHGVRAHKHARFVVVLEDAVSRREATTTPPAEVRLRRLLKLALRSGQLRAISIHEARPHEPLIRRGAKDVKRPGRTKGWRRREEQAEER